MPDTTTTNQEKQPLNIPPQVRKYLEGLLFDAGLTGFDEIMRNAMIEELYVRLDKFLIAKIAEYLPEEKLEEFAKISEENPTQETVQKYLQDNLPNAQEVFTVAFGEFRNVYLQGVEKPQQAV